MIEEAGNSGGKNKHNYIYFVIEFYKCIVLTFIAIALVGIYIKTPLPFTLENLRSKAVDITSIPLVRIQGGSMSVDVENTVDIQGSVSVD